MAIKKPTVKCEAQIQAEILDAIGSLRGVQIMRINTGVFNDDEGNRRIRSVPKGTFDILACVQVSISRVDNINSGSMLVSIPYFYTFGQMVWLEVKMPDKQLSADQQIHSEAWSAAGAICARVTSADEALDLIQNLKNEIPRTRAVAPYAQNLD